MGNVRILSASAGSGKTYRLSYEYVRSVVADPMQYRRILAVTFTNKATEEMKSRILGEIDTLASGKASKFMHDLKADTGWDEDKIRRGALAARTRILHDYSRFAVLTIDKFFQRVIRSFIREIGIELNFNIELKTDSLLSGAADALIDEISTDEALRQALFELLGQRMDENKKWNLKEAVLSLGPEIFRDQYRKAVVGGAPSKQSSEVVGALVQKAERLRRSMRESAQRAVEIIESNGLGVSDFNYGSSGFVTYFYKIARGDISSYGKRVQDALSPDARWASKSAGGRGAAVESLRSELQGILSALVADYDANVRFLNSATLLKENYRNYTLLADLQRKVEELCRQQSILPISETNHILSQLVGDNDAPFIFEKVGNYYSQFMIDEFQDTSALQWENFVPLLENSISQEAGDSVLLVGDVKQSIYRWRGGDWRILASRVQQLFGGDRVSVERLETNWRSLARIVDFNNSMIGTVVENDNRRLGDILSAAAAAGDISASAAESMKNMLADAYEGHRQRANDTSGDGMVRITYYGEGAKREQAVPPIISAVEDLQRRGFRAEDIAIIVRTNDQGRGAASVLLDYKSEHPDSPYCYDVITQEALVVGASPVVMFAVACLRLAVSQDDVQRAVYNRWLDRPYERPLDGQETEFFSSLALLPVEEAFERILLRYDLWRRGQDVAYIQALHEQIVSFAATKVADIELFLDWWSEQGAGQSLSMQRSSSAITVTTIHKSKGLEYPAVIIPYCSWELAPRSTVLWTQAETSDGEWNMLDTVPVRYKSIVGDSYFSRSYYEEQVFSHIDNINLLYVAVTRAGSELHIMIPRGEMKGDNVAALVDAAVHAYGTPDSDITESGGDRVVEFGKPCSGSGRPAPVPEPAKYPTIANRAAVSSRLDSQRYFEDGDADLSPRNFGILMHRAFEGAEDRGRVMEAVDGMLSDALISVAQAEVVKKAVDDASERNPTIREWFSGDWEQVRFEDAIIIPDDTTQRRPDRVMIKGTRAVVVDYKFGRGATAAYRRQVAGYMKLLREMGYADVEGYLWYVGSGEVERVD